VLALLRAVLLLAPGATAPTVVHPMHTAVAEISYDAASRMASIQIRVFADDLYAAVAENSGPTEAEDAISEYLEGRFGLAEPNGRMLPLSWIGAERAGDVVLLRLAARVPNGLAGVRITSTILCERFADQVTIVRASYDGHTTILLFIPGDPAKRLE
jgi:uncharacterized protein DUF6702